MIASTFMCEEQSLMYRYKKIVHYSFDYCEWKVICFVCNLFEVSLITYTCVCSKCFLTFLS